MAIRFDLAQSGTYRVADRYSPTPLVQISGLNGQIFPYIDTNPKAQGDPPTLQAIGFRSRLSYTGIYAAGIPIVANDAYEFTTGGLPLFFVVNQLPGIGPVTLFVFPDGPVTPPVATVNLSNGIVLDAIPGNYPEELSDMYEMAMDDIA